MGHVIAMRMAPVATMGLLALLAVMLLLGRTPTSRPVSSAMSGSPDAGLSQQEVPARALQIAQSHGFQGTSQGIETKQMTGAEFNARLDPYSSDVSSLDKLYWFALLKGTAVWAGAPTQDGAASGTGYDNMWVLLTLDGQEVAVGSTAPGKSLNLASPVGQRRP